jgi:hypothetical protein
MLKSMLPAVAALAVVASPAAAQVSTPGVSLVIRDGKVTLKAEQASIRQILAEWERQGQVKITGTDKLVGAPLTLTLIDIPEKQALEIVMRGVPGYMAVDRVAQADGGPAGSSRFDRVVVMARATTPVAAAPPASLAGSRGMPSPAQPPTAFQQTMPENQAPFAPPVGDEGNLAAGPERNDVEQFQQVEPPMPDAPVVNAGPNSYPGSPYIGANINSGPYGGNPAAAAAAGVNVAQPETQFDYANPQKYFEQRRQQQMQAQQPTSVPTAVPTIGRPVTPVGTTGRPPTSVPTGVPTAPGVLPQPGVAPAPQAPPTPAQGEFFNPYNLPADWVPPPVVPDNGTPIEPDRAKYSNPYNQPQPPE